MNKLIRLSPTGIEYGDYAWNFASGCGNHVNGKCKSGGFACWAYSITQRFDDHYPNGFEPTIYPEALLSPLYLKKPSRILCAFMGDLFWNCPEFDPDRKIETLLPSQVGSLNMSLKGWIFTTIKQCPQHTFLFLTKQPRNLLKFSPFPDNCFVGVTITQCLDGIGYMADVEAQHKFISFEPLLYYSVDALTASELFRVNGISWIILGSQTRPTVSPKIEWVQEILVAAHNAGDLPVFLKDNLRPLIEEKWPGWKLRQEFPRSI